jgi:hypothetical protein
MNDTPVATPGRPVAPARPQRVVPLRKDPLLAAWAAFIVLFPIYIMPSGLPQPADVVLLGLAPFVFARWRGSVVVAHRRAIRALLLFVAYTIISALVWSLWVGELSFDLKLGFLLSPLIYIYNALAFAMGFALYRLRGERLVAITVRATIVSVLFQLPLSFLLGHHNLLRSNGLFNNPNQFGYFAVLSASIILIGQRSAKIPTWYSALGLLTCAYIALLSASKAALAATALIMIVSIITRFRTVMFASVAAGMLLWLLDPAGDVVDHSIERVQTEKSYGFVEERGYDRIFEHPEYWVLGSGEGAYRRYADFGKIGSHELHSSGGTIFFCYGIAGSVVFLWFFFQLVRVAQLRQVLVLGPVVAYGLSHQGMRFTLLWILLALFVVLGDRARALARSRSTQKPRQSPRGDR